MKFIISSLTVFLCLSYIAADENKTKLLDVTKVSQEMREGYDELVQAALSAKGNQFKREKAVKDFTKKWNDKWTKEKLRVSGTVDTVGEFWKKEWTKVTMRVEDSWISFIFLKKEAEKVKNLDTGQSVVIEGTVMTLEEIAKFKGNGKCFFLMNCRLVSSTELENKPTISVSPNELPVDCPTKMEMTPWGLVPRNWPTSDYRLNK